MNAKLTRPLKDGYRMEGHLGIEGRFPNLQVKVFDAENKQSETIELAAA